MTTSVMIVIPTEDPYTTYTTYTNYTKTGNSTPKAGNISSCLTGLLQDNTLPDDAFSASSGKIITVIIIIF